jgi:hypothetical protein
MRKYTEAEATEMVIEAERRGERVALKESIGQLRELNAEVKATTEAVVAARASK